MKMCMAASFGVCYHLKVVIGNHLDCSAMLSRQPTLEKLWGGRSHGTPGLMKYVHLGASSSQSWQLLMMHDRDW